LVSEKFTIDHFNVFSGYCSNHHILFGTHELLAFAVYNCVLYFVLGTKDSLFNFQQKVLYWMVHATVELVR